PRLRLQRVGRLGGARLARGRDAAGQDRRRARQAPGPVGRRPKRLTQSRGGDSERPRRVKRLPALPATGRRFMTRAPGTDRIESERLVLRRITRDDYDFFARIHALPEVGRYIGPGDRALPRSQVSGSKARWRPTRA